MTSETTTTPNVEIVEQFLAAFDHRWPGEEELRELLTEDVCFVERPNLVNPRGSTRDAAAMRSGARSGRAARLAGVSRARPPRRRRHRRHPAPLDRELAVDAGAWPAGTHLAAWCVAHYRLREGRIASIEQHDCYEQPVRKGAG